MMGAGTLFRGTMDGFDFYALRSDRVELRIVPELGAKFTHLADRRSGREWMWRPPGPGKLFRSALGTSFAEGPKWGLDECVPTVGACHWRGRALPDHGEAWTQAWEVDSAALACGQVTTRLQLPISPLHIERTVSLDGPVVTLKYALTNTGQATEEYLWAMHPLLVIAPGDRLRLPAEVTQVTTYLSIGSGLGQCGQTWSWPSADSFTSEDDLSAPGNPMAVKFFTSPLRECWGCIENERTGDHLKISCDATGMDTLGIWINRGGWNGYYHVAIEPTNGGPDALDAAVRQWQRCTTLEPGATRRWTIQIRVGSELPVSTRSA